MHSGSSKELYVSNHGFYEMQLTVPALFKYSQGSIAKNLEFLRLNISIFKDFYEPL